MDCVTLEFMEEKNRDTVFMLCEWEEKDILL